jgi:pyrroline-5-carboxylate reductase
MTNKKSITIIGSGKIAKSLIFGLADYFDVTVVARNKETLTTILSTCSNIKTLHLNEYDITQKNIILCVKNHALDDVSLHLKGKANVLMSVLAGTNIDNLKSKIDSISYIRTMPNIGAEFGSSFTLLTGDDNHKQLSIDIFDKIGNYMWLDNEDELDIGTAISGSGPAYLAMVAESIIEGGISQGLCKKKSMEITLGLFSSYLEIYKRYDPQEIIKKVSSPNGTTVSGCKVLLTSNIKDIFIKTVENATKRAKELSNK